MQLRERPRLGTEWVAMLLALAVTVVLATATPKQVETRSSACRGVEPAAETPRPVATADELRARADRLYRQKSFAAAARVFAGTTDTDLATLGEQYGQLARAWRDGMGGETGRIRIVFRALRDAWKLDTVLGGAHGDELQQRLAHVAPFAAIAFLDGGDRGAAELALHVAETLGVHNEDTRRAAAALAVHSATHN
ncbi:MAG: hypothetical protein KIT31_07565 [Deltaproteobacteria bacterium]|nr:hypothetical protein [Deltaproteobacteria bacterium]